jgi:heme/copper-type cytochrome/quinol oxidase subunit 2
MIVASANGFNDSVDHGVPNNPWPVIDVKKGSTVTILVCNADIQAHGFQVSHYFDGKIETLAPGRTLIVTFQANETGTFSIYCSIPCTVHWAMQSGRLVVA